MTESNEEPRKQPEAESTDGTDKETPVVRRLVTPDLADTNTNPDDSRNQKKTGRTGLKPEEGSSGAEKGEADCARNPVFEDDSSVG
jgi:hypothetical protein